MNLYQTILIIVLVVIIFALLIFCRSSRRTRRPSGRPLPPYPGTDVTATGSEAQPSASSSPSQPSLAAKETEEPDPLVKHFTPMSCIAYIAADADGHLFLFDNYPVRDFKRKEWHPSPDHPLCRYAEADFFRPYVNITWDDEPRVLYASTFPSCFVSNEASIC